MKDNTKTRMTLFINRKFKISDEIRLLWSSQSFEGKYNFEFGIPIEFQSQRKKIIQIGPKTKKLNIYGQRVI